MMLYAACTLRTGTTTVTVGMQETLGRDRITMHVACVPLTVGSIEVAGTPLSTTGMRMKVCIAGMPLISMASADMFLHRTIVKRWLTSRTAYKQEGMIRPK